MRNITITGDVDKRILVYPLARALSILGKTVIVTDDGSVKRLYHGLSNMGMCSGVGIIVAPSLDDGTDKCIDNFGETFVNRIYMGNNFIKADSAVIIKCHGVDKSLKREQYICSDEVSEESLNDEFITDVTLTVTKPRQKVDNCIKISSTDLVNLAHMEECKELMVFNNKQVNTFLAKKTAKMTGMPESEWMKVFTRKQYVTKKGD